MRLGDLTGTSTLTATRDDSPDEIARLMHAARVHHIPQIDGQELIGIWVLDDDGALTMLDPGAVHQTTPEADALEALSHLVGGSEAVLAWRDGAPAGVVTRSDVIELLRAGLAAAPGRASRPPVVIRLVGPARSGKSTLLARTMPALAHCRAAVVQANPSSDGTDDPLRQIGGAAVVVDPHAHWRKGLRAAVSRLPDAHVVLVEDRDAPAQVGVGIGEDAQVLVIRASDLDDLTAASVREAQALVVTHLDESADVRTELERLKGANPALEVFALDLSGETPELTRWLDWVEHLVLPRAR